MNLNSNLMNLNSILAAADGLLQRCDWASCIVCSHNLESCHHHDDEHTGFFPMTCYTPPPDLVPVAGVVC